MNSILLLDDSADLLDLGRIMIERRCDSLAITARSLAEVIAQREQIMACTTAILDINLGPNEPNGIDTYQWLRSNGFNGRIIFLTGHADSHPLVSAAIQLGDARVFSKPLAAGDLVRMIRGEYDQ